MSAGSQSIAKTESAFALALGICIVVFVLLAVAFLRIFGVPLAAFALLLLVVTSLWMAFRYPTTTLGVVLALMSIYPMTFLIAKFFGPPYVALLEGSDRAVVLGLACILWWKNGIKLRAPDWFLLACFGLAVVRLAFGGSLIILLADFSFVIAYAAGRVAPLSEVQQSLWARCAVWIIAVLSVVGMVEVFVTGPDPRSVLYFSVANAFAADGKIDGRFFATSFAGLRESSTMISPPFFALLCMTALVLWWVYCRNHFPAVVICAGLICTITRSAWFATVAAVVVLAVVMGQKRRLALYATLALALFVASVPILGLGDYLLSTKTGMDPSAQEHQDSLVEGSQYVLGHPFGAGPGNYDRPAGGQHTENMASSAPFIENTYLTLASQYGVLTALCFLGFLLSALRLSLREPNRLGYTSVGILVGFGGAMVVAPLLREFAPASWIWFPVGMVVRSSALLQDRRPDSQQTIEQ